MVTPRRRATRRPCACTGTLQAGGGLVAAPGVIKTYAMLCEAQRRQRRGADVVAGFVQSYGRPLTEALINGLEVIPRKAVNYRGTRLEQMDLDAVLRRRPGSLCEMAQMVAAGRNP